MVWRALHAAHGDEKRITRHGHGSFNKESQAAQTALNAIQAS